jgi:flagellar hook protein FlgE
MMKSLSSAVSGLEAQQTAMNVIGNNIANVNTDGFRSSSTNFEDLFYQTLNPGTSEVDPSQVGYGAQVSNVSKNMTSQGATQTDNPTDLYIDGSGYFAVNTKLDPSTNAPIGQTYYTRVGHFSFDQNGYLVDGNGNYVMSESTDESTGDVTLSPVDLGNATTPMYLIPNDGSAPILINGTNPPDDSGTNISQLSNIAIGSDGSITASLGDATGTIATSSDATAGVATNPERIGLANFLNEAGLSEVGNNYYVASQSSGAPSYTTAGNNNSTVIRTNALEMSNVDLASEFTNMIITERGFQANARVITVSDSMLDELLSLKRS